jgi:hypothetical protein
VIEVAVVPARDWHAKVIADAPREADVAELAALGTDPLQAMFQGIKASVEPMTGFVGGRPVCMFGASPFSILGGIGVPWLIGSAAMDSMTAHKALLRESRRAFARMRRQFPVLLFNAVDDRNEAAKRWLAWLGFTLDELKPLGRNGEPFRVFYWKG